MHISFIDAKHQQLSRIYGLITDHWPDHSFIVHHVQKSAVKELREYIETHSSLVYQSANTRRAVNKGEIYIIPENQTFSFDGRHIRVEKQAAIGNNGFADTILKESEIWNRYMGEMSRELVCTHTPDGISNYVSPSAYKLLGYRPEELVGKDPYNYFHPDDQERMGKYAYEAATKGERTGHIQYRFRRKDGTYIWLDTYIELIKNADGQVTSVISGSRDISDLKKAEIRLKESEERFRAIADNIPGVIYLCLNDAAYSMLYLNEEIESLTGYEREDFLENRVSITDLFHPDDRDMIFRKVDKALQDQKPFHVTYRMRTKYSDSWVWVDEYGQGIYEDGQLRLIEGVLLNITERKNAEARLQEREANLQAIFESTNNMIGLFDTDKRLLEFNQSFADYVKATDDVDLYQGMELISKLNPKMVDTFRGLQERVLSGEKFKVTFEYPTSNGVLHFMSSLNPIYQHEEITGFSLFVEDITELKESQLALQQYTENLEDMVAERTRELKVKNKELLRGNAELEKALNDLKATEAQLIQAEKMASLGVLAAGIGHEINNPLNFIKNGCSALYQLLQEEPGLKEETLQPYFKIIDDGVYRASEIVKSLSHFSRQVKSMEEECAIHDIIDNCLIILNSRLKDRVNVVKQYCEQKLVVMGNEGKLHQAFLNILSNAEQAIDDQGKITIVTGHDKNGISIRFQDNGIGIPEADISRIGDPFFTTKAPGKGTGLGLFITYSIIKEFNGAIEVESKQKKGSVFTIMFPNT